MAETVRKAVIFCSSIFTLIGMGLSIAAILTPSWQVVNLQEYNSIHEHGLWLDCIRHTRDGGGVLLRRSMEFEHPVFVQQAPPSTRPRIAAPYNMKQTDMEFGRAVADSMPELSRDRSYPSDIAMGGRISRKSETCV
uniref:Col_cuticle_N domain-containing protein n=1 Tax=Meloidogyne hapla TaxID=6305 RepID=A0A1I8B9G8_MELHA